MSLQDFFTIKFPWQRKEEERIYGQWAFPFGAAQKQAVEALLKALLPNEDIKMAMAIYLTGREGYRNDCPLKTPAKSAHDPYAAGAKALRSALPPKLRGQIPMYLAVIADDAEVNASLNYHTPQELLERAATLERYV